MCITESRIGDQYLLSFFCIQLTSPLLLALQVYFCTRDKRQATNIRNRCWIKNRFFFLDSGESIRTGVEKKNLIEHPVAAILSNFKNTRKRELEDFDVKEPRKVDQLSMHIIYRGLSLYHPELSQLSDREAGAAEDQDRLVRFSRASVWPAEPSRNQSSSCDVSFAETKQKISVVTRRSHPLR